MGVGERVEMMVGVSTVSAFSSLLYGSGKGRKAQRREMERVSGRRDGRREKERESANSKSDINECS